MKLFKAVSVSLEIVVRLFFVRIVPLIGLLVLYIMKSKRLVLIMREKKNHLYVDSGERSILLHSLVELKNQLIQQGRYTDCVDELIFKVIHAPIKKLRVELVGGSDVR